MLENAYDSVSIAEKIPYTEENIKNEITKYFEETSDKTYTIVSSGDILTVKGVEDPFELINHIDMTFGFRHGFKYINNDLIIPLS